VETNQFVVSVVLVVQVVYLSRKELRNTDASASASLLLLLTLNVMCISKLCDYVSFEPGKSSSLRIRYYDTIHIYNLKKYWDIGNEMYREDIDKE
jgi:hypothetical protein